MKKVPLLELVELDPTGTEPVELVSFPTGRVALVELVSFPTGMVPLVELDEPVELVELDELDEFPEGTIIGTDWPLQMLQAFSTMIPLNLVVIQSAIYSN